MIGEKSDGLDALTEIRPILFSCGRSGEPTRQPDYRNVDIPPWTIHRETSTAANLDVDAPPGSEKDGILKALFPPELLKAYKLKSAGLISALLAGVVLRFFFSP
jgi:hypothetical protein